MTDTNVVTEEVKAPKKKVAEHFLIAVDGTVTEDEKLATGIGYKLVDLPNDPFTVQIATMLAASILMLANFGAKTLATNESSQARNSPKGEATAQEQMDAVRERFALIELGEWIDRTREGGAKVDKPLLAQAIKQANPAITRSVEEILAKLESDANYLRGARGIPAVATVYAALVGRPTKTVDDLAF